MKTYRVHKIVVLITIIILYYLTSMCFACVWVLWYWYAKIEDSIYYVVYDNCNLSLNSKKKLKSVDVNSFEPISNLNFEDSEWYYLDNWSSFSVVWSKYAYDNISTYYQSRKIDIINKAEFIQLSDEDKIDFIKESKYFEKPTFVDNKEYVIIFFVFIILSIFVILRMKRDGKK